MREHWLGDKVAVVVTFLVVLGILSNEICRRAPSDRSMEDSAKVAAELERIGFYDMNEADWLEFQQRDPNEIQLSDAARGYLALYGESSIRRRSARQKPEDHSIASRTFR